jgi:hypothetical protein
MKDATVIIGHGPSLQGAKKGEYIDSFKYVIRFPYLKNWQIPADYGTRTSYFCASIQRALKFLRPTLPEYGYFIWSKNNMSLPVELKFLIKKFGGRNITRLVNTWQKRLPESNREPYFSHGTAAVCAAAGILKKPVTILGCDMLSAGKNNLKKYVGSSTYEGRKINKRSHNLKAERQIINTMAKHYNIAIGFE